jgi:LAS superfamily LD-carboxypeptidase LdcB
MRGARYYTIILFIILAICLFGIYAGESEPPPDSVKISGKYYQIKPPWLGNGLGSASDPIPDNLAMVPRQYAFDSSRIFVTRETRDAFVAMVKQAEKDGVFFKAKSGFRSYAYQRQLFAARMSKGRSFEQVCKNVAPPGYSQHMLGQAFDLAADTVPFADSKAYKWLKANASKFGFVESYPENTEDGFSWEAWHWRYMWVAKDTLK